MVKTDHKLVPSRQGFESKSLDGRKKLSPTQVPQRLMSAVAVDGAVVEEKRSTKTWVDVSESEIDCFASSKRAAIAWAGLSDCTYKDDYLGGNRPCQHRASEC